MLPVFLTRPGMYATDGRAYDVQAGTLLADLCFLDERETDGERVREVLRGYGTLGVVGPFEALFGEGGRYVDEVASVFAEQFHSLGYLAVDRLLDKAGWDELIGSLHDRFDGHDVRRSEVEAAFGPPSLAIGKRVLCYAPSEGAGWVFFDCYSEPVSRYEAGLGRYTADPDHDPLVRSVRRPAEGFDAGLILTLYGKVLRWGPGWWIHQPDHLPAEQQAIAAQLRGIEAQNPSIALRPTPPVAAKAATSGHGTDRVWVFHGEHARFASGVFTDKATALAWAERHQVTGVLTEYPIGDGCYDLAVAHGSFTPSKPHHGSPEHVAGFSPSQTQHLHLRDGRRED